MSAKYKEKSCNIYQLNQNLGSGSFLEPRFKQKMAENNKIMNIELVNNHNEIYVEFDQELIDSLIQDDAWIEVIRITTGGKPEHRLYNPGTGPIICFKWF
jgi:hypothetical protein